MKKFFRSVFSGRKADASAGEVRAEPTSDRIPEARTANSERPSEPASGASVLSGLRAFIVEASSEALAADEIDSSLRMYDAGYLDSFTGVELLVHVEGRYGLFISEVDVVGKLDTLDALADHIVANAS
jgi:acyl carrier protein